MLTTHKILLTKTPRREEERDKNSRQEKNEYKPESHAVLSVKIFHPPSLAFLSLSLFLFRFTLFSLFSLTVDSKPESLLLLSFFSLFTLLFPFSCPSMPPNWSLLICDLIFSVDWFGRKNFTRHPITVGHRKERNSLWMLLSLKAKTDSQIDCVSDKKTRDTSTVSWEDISCNTGGLKERTASRGLHQEVTESDLY